MRGLWIGVAALVMLALASTAGAVPWAEVGDAGDLPGTAQVPNGVGALTSISGKITDQLDVDMYQIFVTSGGTFSATTVGTGTTIDTQLFLFDSTGLGVLANDDAAGSGTFQSTLPDTFLAPGIYYLAISTFDRDPVSAGGLIFLSNPFGDVHPPDGPGGGSPISGYIGFGSTGEYTIALTGATPIPEPGTLLLLGSGLLGAGAFGQRFRKRR